MNFRPTNIDPQISEPEPSLVEVPTFDGNLIHWKQFWDQFAVSVLSDNVLPEVVPKLADESGGGLGKGCWVNVVHLH